MERETGYFGEKNYYYKNKNMGANNLKNLILENGFEDFSAEGISSFFYFRYPIKYFTMFKGIKQLDSKTKIDKRGEIKYLWKPNFEVRNLDVNMNIKKIEELLLNSIDKLIGNKKIIGVTLSGGIDSSLVAAMIKKHYPNKELYTYSCGFYGDDEFEYSRKIANLYSDKHTEIILGKEDFIGRNSIIKPLIKNKMAPLHPNELALAVLEEKAKLDLCDIVLCGEGADDIFGGYGKNLRFPFNYNGEKENFHKDFLKKYIYFTEEEVKKIIKNEYYIESEKLVEDIFLEEECPEELEEKILYFIQRIHTRGLIERGKNALNYNGFKNGFPFIEQNLIEYVNHIPFEQKIAWKENVNLDEVKTEMEISEKYDIPKYILKKIAEKYLPKEIIYRPKKGFPVPFDKWFNDLIEYPLDKTIFKTQDISFLNGWKKYMVINLNYFIEILSKYKIKNN